MKFKSISCLFVLLAGLSARAATFTVTPNVVSNDYLGLITFQMSGLSFGETVQVQEFFDANHDGTVDPGDYGVRFETVSDGGLKEIAGLPNPNSFHDLDGATNGAITAAMPFALAADTTRAVGHYIFRMSSPSNHFAATNLLFTVTSPNYAQSVQGTVQNNATNIPFAIVALTQRTSSGRTLVTASIFSDAGGNYLISAPPGTYTVRAFLPGYVGDSVNSPSITLEAGATVTTNLNLIAATSFLSGSLVDSTNFALPAVPDAYLTAYSATGLITIAVADSNGNFTIPVTANNLWYIRANVQSAIPEAYMPVGPGTETPFQTFTGPVTNALVLFKRATAVLYGQVQDNHGDSIPGVSLSASADGGQYDGNAISDTNGNYFLAIDGGIGFIEVEYPSDAPASNFIWSGTQFSIDDGQADNTNVIGIIPSAQFLSLVTDDTGAPVTNVFCFASCLAGTSEGNTGTNGMLDIPVFAGTWNLYIGAGNLIFPVIPPFTITNGINFTYNIIARTITGHISGQVENSSSVGIPNIDVMLTNSVGPTNFALGAFTDADGDYSVAVFNGTWNVSLYPSSLQAAGYYPVDPLSVTVPPTNAIADFVPETIVILPPQILTTNLPGSVLGDFYFVELDVTNGAGYLNWSLDSGALPGGLALEYFGVEVITGTITNFGLFNFTLQVTDSKGETTTEALSINVLAVAPGPLLISTTSLPNGAMDCPYTNQVQATGGTPPYSWTLAPPSVPLPAGLKIGSDGTVSGDPTTNNFYEIDFQVSDSAGQTNSQLISLLINPSLQVYAGALSGGELGLDYSGGLYSSGGQQPQTWSILSGSLPPVLMLDPPSGDISGMPTTPGTYNFTAQVSDGCVTVDLATSITIYAAPLITTTGTTLFATTGAPFNAQLGVSGGAAPFYFYTAGPLPDYLYLGSDGLFSGTSYFDSTNSFEVEVYDSLGGVGTANLTIITSLLPLLDDPAMLAPHQFSFRVTGVSGQSYTAQYSSNLANWMELYTTNAPDTIFFVADTNATGSRFYRLKVNN
jgi:hypothetical protein